MFWLEIKIWHNIVPWKQVNQLRRKEPLGVFYSWIHSLCCHGERAALVESRVWCETSWILSRHKIYSKKILSSRVVQLNKWANWVLHSWMHSICSRETAAQTQDRVCYETPWKIFFRKLTLRSYLRFQWIRELQSREVSKLVVLGNHVLNFFQSRVPSISLTKFNSFIRLWLSQFYWPPPMT